ncbi:MAG: winged helix-turn-helix transcriptional regulator [Rhodobacter sp.]|nr:winged helix-turn-helix transcriptional regulator [Paracoccaceae bacterium]MCC0077751.1 winged helix-turn-helix transcriptional regulator [Rhodobacter sp.]
MTTPDESRMQELQNRADEVAGLLKQIANARRLVILCRLADGDATVSELCAVADLSPSAMSQHLAKLRAEGLVNAHKDGLQVHYTLTNQRCIDLLEHLKGTFCATPGPASRAG